MKMSLTNSSARGQTSLEYLLLLAVVAVVVIAGFSSGSLIDQVRNAAGGYYNTVTRVIMGNGNETIDGKQITPINGGWCQVASPPAGSFGPTIMYRSCECPAPAFGGLYCGAAGNNNKDPCLTGAGQTCNGAQVTFTGVIACGPNGAGCPTGQQCLPPDGHCGCPPGETYNGSACVPSCGTNMYYDTQKNDCECDQYAYPNPDTKAGGCLYCPPCQSYDAQQKVCVDASTTICPPSGNWTCTPPPPGAEANNLCQCWTGTHPNGPPTTGCVF